MILAERNYGSGETAIVASDVGSWSIVSAEYVIAFREVSFGSTASDEVMGEHCSCDWFECSFVIPISIVAKLVRCCDVLVLLWMLFLIYVRLYVFVVVMMVSIKYFCGWLFRL